MNTSLLIIIGYVIFYYISWMIKKHKIKKENFNNKKNLFTVEVKKQPPSEFQLYNQLMKKKKNQKKEIETKNLKIIDNKNKTKYKNPKKMTTQELKLFLKEYKSDFTIQDYKNWLSLKQYNFKDLSDIHIGNLHKLLKNKPILPEDMPIIDDRELKPNEYFMKIYLQKQAKKLSSTIEEEPQLAYNYTDYNNNIPPIDLKTTKVLTYDKNKKNIAMPLNSQL